VGARQRGMRIPWILLCSPRGVKELITILSCSSFIWPATSCKNDATTSVIMGLIQSESTPARFMRNVWHSSGKSASLDEPARSSLMWIPEGTQVHKLTPAAYTNKFIVHRLWSNAHSKTGSCSIAGRRKNRVPFLPAASNQRKDMIYVRNEYKP